MADRLLSDSGSFIPLFSFNTIVDTDLGLLNYVFQEFRNENLFDLNVLDYAELINKVYYRQFENPLYTIMRNPDSEDDKKFLDECYQEFLQTKEQEILYYSVGTQIAELLKLFIKEPSIHPFILCYTEKQTNFIKNLEDFIGCGLVSPQEVAAYGQGEYSQYYFKYLEELYLIAGIKDRNIYISNCGLNLNKEKDDIREFEVLDNLMINNNDMNIIELYRKDVIGKDSYLYGSNNS